MRVANSFQRRRGDYSSLLAFAASFAAGSFGITGLCSPDQALVRQRQHSPRHAALSSQGERARSFLYQVVIQEKSGFVLSKLPVSRSEELA